MAKIKVVLNKPEPSRETINKYKYRHKNSLIKDYQRMHTLHGLKSILYKDKVMFYLIAVIGVIMFILIVLGV